jgi:hypothetical protein
MKRAFLTLVLVLSCADGAWACDQRSCAAVAAVSAVAPPCGANDGCAAMQAPPCSGDNCASAPFDRAGRGAPNAPPPCDGNNCVATER